MTIVERGNPLLIKIITKSNTLMTQLRIPRTTAEQVIVPLTSADYWGADLKG